MTILLRGKRHLSHFFLALVFGSGERAAATDPTPADQRHRQQGKQLPEVKPRIIGGSPADTNEYPTYGFNSGPVGLCGGTLIHPDVVLTAAHCASLFLDGWSQGGNSVFGDTNSVSVGVAREFPHPDYNVGGANANDIMLLKLESPLSNAPLQKVNFDTAFPLPVSNR